VNRTGRILAVFICLALASAFVAAPACLAQEGGAKTTTGSVPGPVLQAFHDAYPKAEITGMANRSDGDRISYEIRSADGGTSRTVTYLADGTLIAVVEDVTVAELPAPVTAGVEAKYPGAKIVKALSDTRDGATTFLLKIVAGDRRLNVVFAPDGTFLRSRDTGRGVRRSTGK
jgi:hypothetical protein